LLFPINFPPRQQYKTTTPSNLRLFLVKVSLLNMAQPSPAKRQKCDEQ
jgi:hypothetical protein